MKPLHSTYSAVLYFDFILKVGFKNFFQIKNIIKQSSLNAIKYSYFKYEIFKYKSSQVL